MNDYDYMAERDDALREHRKIKEQAERLRFRVAELSAALEAALEGLRDCEAFMSEKPLGIVEGATVRTRPAREARARIAAILKGDE